MSQRPLLVAGHPRSCSTAFERVFLTQTDTLQCFHEPFAMAAWWGPEHYEGGGIPDEVRAAHPCSGVTFRSVVDDIREVAKVGKRALIKDFPRYFLHPSPSTLGTPAPSFTSSPSSSPEPPTNPSLLPLSVLASFDWAVLVRSPNRTVPSYYRMCIPPANATTGMTSFPPENLGFKPLRRLLEFLLAEGIVERGKLAVLDADDMLDDPAGTLHEFCSKVGIEWDGERMLAWTEEDRDRARGLFKASEGWHDDALEASSLVPRERKGAERGVEEEDEEWRAKWGEEVQGMLRRAVDDNMEDYEWIKGLGRGL